MYIRQTRENICVLRKSFNKLHDAVQAISKQLNALKILNVSSMSSGNTSSSSSTSKNDFSSISSDTAFFSSLAPNKYPDLLLWNYSVCSTILVNDHH